jgi:hypothetical protein
MDFFTLFFAKALFSNNPQKIKSTIDKNGIVTSGLTIDENGIVSGVTDIDENGVVTL